ncbi:hypothetical protein COCCADRAFT_85135, partial [Bipolaris zeicola 26-R-13]
IVCLFRSTSLAYQKWPYDVHAQPILLAPLSLLLFSHHDVLHSWRIAASQ